MMMEDIIRQVVTDAVHNAVRDALDEIDLDPDPPAVPAPVEQREPRALSVVEAAERLGISRSKLYELIRDGDLQTVRVGGRRLVMSPVIEEFLIDHAEPTQASCCFCNAPAVASCQLLQGRRGVVARVCQRRACLLRLVDAVADG